MREALDFDGTFTGDWHGDPRVCPACYEYEVQARAWEGSRGSLEVKLRCTACGCIWWTEGERP